MKALAIYAGRKALEHLERNGLGSADVRTVAGAAGGPKALILGPLDRFLFGHWLPQSAQSVDLVGGSIGACRLAAACRSPSAGWSGYMPAVGCRARKNPVWLTSAAAMDRGCALSMTIRCA